MTWSDFELQLFSIITDLATRTILIIGEKNPEGKAGVPFIQFAGINALYGGNSKIIAEICGENVSKDMAIFTTRQRNDLEKLGFTPSEDGTTWQQQLPWPAPSQAIKNTVQACTLRLRDIGGIASPGQLVYKAWRYPNNSNEADVNHDPGDRNLHILELGIQREQSNSSDR